MTSRENRELYVAPAFSCVVCGQRDSQLRKNAAKFLSRDFEEKTKAVAEALKGTKEATEFRKASGNF